VTRKPHSRKPVPANRRYPIQALASEVGLTVDALCKRMGRSGAVQTSYRELGLSELVADRWAAAFGLPAPYVWPEMIDHAIEDFGPFEDDDESEAA